MGFALLFLGFAGVLLYLAVWTFRKIADQTIEAVKTALARQEILVRAILTGAYTHSATTHRQLDSITDNLIYVKNFCEEYSWRLVHFTDEELAELAEGERIRQERIEHQGNDPSIQWSFGDSRPIGMGGSFAASLVRESVGGEVVRYDSRDQVTDRRANGSASAGGEV